MHSDALRRLVTAGSSSSSCEAVNDGLKFVRRFPLVLGLRQHVDVDDAEVAQHRSLDPVSVGYFPPAGATLLRRWHNDAGRAIGREVWRRG